MNTICPVCQSSEIEIFFERNNVPAHQNLLGKTRDDALACAHGDILLGACRECTFVYNTKFSADLVPYGPEYHISQASSPRFQEYLDSLTTYLIYERSISNKNIIEIGCGTGEFLSEICRRGNNHGVGFDPSIPPSLTRASGNVTFLPCKFDSSGSKHYQADCILCRHTLEHIAQPADFLKVVREFSGDNDEILVYFEVPNFDWISGRHAIWAISYEHCNWFRKQSLSKLFQRTGFSPPKFTQAFADEYLWVESFPNIGIDEQQNSDSPTHNLDEFLANISSLGEGFEKKRSQLKSQFSRILESSERPVLWGAAGKGVTLLNALCISDRDLTYAIDIDPSKQGKFIPGTGQQVVPLSHMVAYRPDTVIATNSLYIPEMRKMLNTYDLFPSIVLIN